MRLFQFQEDIISNAMRNRTNKLWQSLKRKDGSMLVVGGNRMRHKIEIDESQRQLIMLALAELCEQRPGWEHALGVTAMQFPGGLDLFKQFLDMNAEQVLNAMSDIK